MIYAADFETATTEPTYVWAWGVEPLDEETFQYGTDIESFFHFVSTCKSGTVFYFHNLKFDGSFLIQYLLTHGYTYSEEKEGNTFECLITDMNQWYMITVRMKYRTQKRREKIKNIYFYDSLKLIPLSIKQMPKTFGLGMEKLEIDYDADEEGNYVLTEEKKEYLKHDVEILKNSLITMFEHGINKMTMAASAFSDLRERFGKQKFERFFPRIAEREILETSLKDLTLEEQQELSADKRLRKAYRGGWCYLRKGLEEKELQDVYVYDVNSLYPFIMNTKPLPFGKPIINESIEPIPNYDLQVIQLSCAFEIKEGYLPTIQIKKSMLFNPTEYLESSNGEIVWLSVTSVDYQLMIEHYDLYDMEIEKVYHFRSATRLFSEYIEFWNHVKELSQDNPGLRFIAKRMNNSCYGKFATSPVRIKRVPELQDGVLKFHNLPPTYEPGYYLPVGIFITSWARDYIIRHAQAHQDHFVYCDTDSLHLDAPCEDIPIDDRKLGYFKLEKKFDRAKYIRAKRYIGEKDGILQVTCAGLPATCHDQVTFDNFKTGTVYTGKLLQKQVVGGVILTETSFLLK